MEVSSATRFTALSTMAAFLASSLPITPSTSEATVAGDAIPSVCSTAIAISRALAQRCAGARFRPFITISSISRVSDALSELGGRTGLVRRLWTISASVWPSTSRLPVSASHSTALVE